MIVGQEFNLLKQDETKDVITYTVEMKNDEVVCLSHMANGKKNYNLYTMENFYSVFCPSPPKEKSRPQKYDASSFDDASRPLVKWLNDNYGSNLKAIITSTSAELMSSEFLLKEKL